MDFEAFIDNCRDEIIRATQELIRIKSVKGVPEPGKPNGKGPNAAFEYVLGLSRSLGFAIRDLDGYVGHAELGDGNETVGILVHVDVVPEGDGWTYPPYAGEIHDGKIYGRGSLDDKGPTIAALYALKALKESGGSLNKTIRIVFGTDEESGFGGIDYYLSREKAFDIGFTPDASFPAINGEKGILVFSLHKAIDCSNKGHTHIKSIKGGSAPNMVPDSCTAVIGFNNGKKSEIAVLVNEFKRKYGYALDVEVDGSDLILCSTGRTAHASTPEEGLNAISIIMLFLKELELDDNNDMHRLIEFYNKKIGMEYNGGSLGCSGCDTMSGPLTLNVGIIEVTESKFELKVDVRYPITSDGDELAETVRKEMLGEGIHFEQLFAAAPIYFPADHLLIQKLMKVYRKITNERESKPITIGGATYARSMKNVVAFGPVFPGEAELAHQKDEYITIENLIKMTKIFAYALYELSVNSFSHS